MGAKRNHGDRRRGIRSDAPEIPERVLKIEKIGSDEGVGTQNLGEMTKTGEKIKIS